MPINKQGNVVDSRACDNGRMLMLNTGYRILPSRVMYPENFEHPPESLGEILITG